MAKKKAIKVIKERHKTHIPFAFKISMGVISVKETASIQRVARVLAKNQIGAVLVTSDDYMTGIISERDIVYKVVARGAKIERLKARDIMTRNVVTVNLEDGMKTIHEQMKTLPFRHLPVAKEDKIVGMISNRDLMYLRRLKTVHAK